MMRKSKILYYSILFVSLACFVLDLIFNFEFFRISFGASLILMGLWLIVRAFSHKIDSGLFLGITLLGFGALNLTGYFLNRYLNFDKNGLWPYYLFVLSLASLVTGLYFKVLDSDDWFDTNALKAVANTLHNLHSNGKVVDMFIANYVYDKPSENKQAPIRYTNVLPQNRIFGWKDIKRFLPHQNLLMHSVIYRTQLLRDCNLQLPKHTFYVDNIFVYQPLPQVKTMYYMDINLYRYFIGREGQSVN